MYGYAVVMKDEDLQHYGILGMKWGVRRYQNPDGSLTKEGTARYNKEFARKAKKAFKKERPYHSLDKISSLTGSALTDEQKKTLAKKYKKFIDESNKFDKAEEDFIKSDENYEANRKAYNDTVNWYKKHDPEKLEKWSKEIDTGKDWSLNNFHEFSKDFEYRSFEEVKKARDKFYKVRGVDEKKYDKSYDDFSAYLDETTRSLVGKYGDKKLKDISTNTNLSSYVRSGILENAKGHH